MAALTLALLVTAATPVRAIIISASGDNGDGSFGITTAPEYSGVVGVLHRKPDGLLVTEASGVMISPLHVLSCAHGFFQQERGQKPADYFIQVEGIVFPVTAIGVSPEFSLEEHVGDLAVFTLSRPVPPRVRWYPCNGGKLNELAIGNCTLVGLGISGSATKGMNRDLPMGIKRMATNHVDFVSDGTNGLRDENGNLVRQPRHTLLIDFDNHRTPEVNGAGKATPGHPLLPGKGTHDLSEGVTVIGDSGCPMFQRDPENGALVIVGIASSGGGGYHGGVGDFSVFTRVAPYLRWVQETMAAGEPKGR